jgi:hypothetical protein
VCALRRSFNLFDEGGFEAEPMPSTIYINQSEVVKLEPSCGSDLEFIERGSLRAKSRA